MDAQGVAHRYAAVNGVRLHYVEAGTGPLVVLLHGFPEFWYSWRLQIPALASAGFHVVAPDLRGYNQSAKPLGVRQYGLEMLTGDVVGLVNHLGARRAAVAGHDWGGVIAWDVAMDQSDVVDRLIILNAPHPAAFRREIRTCSQLLRSWYAFFFQLPWLPEFAFRAARFGLLERTLPRDPVRKGAFTEENIAVYKAAIAEPGALTAGINYYRALFRATLRRRGRRVTQVLEKMEKREKKEKRGHSTYSAPRWKPACLLRLKGAGDKVECPLI